MSSNGSQTWRRSPEQRAKTTDKAKNGKDLQECDLCFANGFKEQWIYVEQVGDKWAPKNADGSEHRHKRQGGSGGSYRKVTLKKIVECANVDEANLRLQEPGIWGALDVGPEETVLVQPGDATKGLRKARKYVLGLYEEVQQK